MGDTSPFMTYEPITTGHSGKNTNPQMDHGKSRLTVAKRYLRAIGLVQSPTE